MRLASSGSSASEPSSGEMEHDTHRRWALYSAMAVQEKGRHVEIPASTTKLKRFLRPHILGAGASAPFGVPNLKRVFHDKAAAN